MKLVALCGFKGSGKNWTSHFIRKHYDFEILSFSDPIKDIMSSIFDLDRNIMIGSHLSDREKKENRNEFLSRICEKNLSVRDAMIIIGETLKEKFSENLWINIIEHRIRKNNFEKVVISDLRLKSEYEWIKRNHGKIVLVKKNRPEWFDIAKKAAFGDRESLEKMKEKNIHRTEFEWLSFDYDLEIHFSSTLEELENTIRNHEKFFCS